MLNNIEREYDQGMYESYQGSFKTYGFSSV